MEFLRTALRMLGEALRRTIQITITLTVLFTALFMCWFAGNSLMKLMDLLKRTVFSKPW